MKKRPIKILFDTSVLMHGVLGVPAIEKQLIKWGETEQEVEVLRTIKKPSKTGNQNWLNSQIKCLPTIARLIKENQVIPYESTELKMELFRRSKIGQATVYAFKDCKFLHAKSPIERSHLFQTINIGQHATAEALRSYCIWLLETPNETLDKILKSPVAERFSDFERNNIRNLDLFRNLCGNIEKRHYPDAYHLWTAEVNDLNYYMMNEKKFRQEIDQKGKANLNCQIVSPQELLEAMNIRSLDKIQLEHGKFYGL